ncbi:MAG: universal stress protein [Burkholderiaceae bacterium]
MFKHILVPTDGSDLSIHALRWALGAARDLGNVQVLVLNVQPPFIPPTVADIPVAMVYPPDDYDKSAQETANGILHTAQEIAKGYGLTIETLYVQHASPYEAICETAEARSCDLIVMGSHGRKTFARLLLGSETTKVLSHTKVPVLICK